MNENTTRIILILSALSAVAGFLLMLVMPSLAAGPKLALGGSAISQMASIFYLWPSATITRKKIWKPIIGALILSAVGTYLYQHSAIVGTSLTLLGYIGVVGFYFIHYLQKKKKVKLDQIKVMWVVFTYFLIMMNSYFDSLPTNLEYLTTPLLWYGAYIYFKEQSQHLDERKKAGW